MKRFVRIEPTIIQEFGRTFKQQAVIKTFRTDDGLQHEFTTVYAEGMRGVAVVALTTDHQVVTTFQFRAGPEQWVYELPGGGVYDAEDIEAAARRELQEETGYVPGKLLSLGKSHSDGYCNYVCHYYLATDCTLSGTGRLLDDEEHEQGAEVRLLAISDFIEHAKYGEMTDVRAVLLAYEKLKELEGTK